MPLTLLETFIANVNANAFFPEFTFAATEFPVAGQGERELADHIVLIGDSGMIFQLKEREAGAPADLDAVTKWFDNKVRKRAVKQLRDTRQMLQEFGGMPLRNQAGHLVPVAPPDISRLVGVVVYRAPVRLADPPRLYDSASAGLVHFFPDDDYADLCKVLKTPVEITDYLTFRTRMVTTHAAASAVVSERALIGQFLAEAGDVPPSMKFEAVLDAWRDDETAYDLTFALRHFGSRIVSRDGANVSETSHHNILREFARLSRSELACFKTYWQHALEAVRVDRYEPPCRMYVPRLHCGFAIIPLPTAMAADSRRALRTLGSLSKHAFKATRHVALTMVQRPGAVDIDWLHEVGPYQPNAALDAALAEHWPFRLPPATKSVPRYTFDSDTLDRILAP